MEEPYKWVIVKITQNKENPIYKIFASFIGESWKLNSGIKLIEEDEKFFNFYGYSGSCYKCRKPNYGVAGGYCDNVLDNIIKETKKIGATIEVMPEDTDWMELLN